MLESIFTYMYAVTAKNAYNANLDKFSDSLGSFWNILQRKKWLNETHFYLTLFLCLLGSLPFEKGWWWLPRG